MRASRSSSEQKGDQRREGQTSGDENADGAQGDSGASEGSSGGAGGRDSETPTDGTLRETHRTWGHLPPRDRDAIMQGSVEESHDKYREQIDRYFETLSDPEFDQ